MPFTEEILQYKSLAFAGLEKNTGKTECLNYVLKKLAAKGRKIALTSIGLDGEGIDQLTHTHKPEITLYEGMVFVTGEKFFRKANIKAEILELSNRYTATGRLVIAEAKSRGKAIIAGPAQTLRLKEIIDTLPRFGVQTTLVDGAFSRLSFAAPSVVESIILSTGASLSANMDELLRQTIHTVNLINLPLFDHPVSKPLAGLDDGIYAVDEAGEIQGTGVKSIFLLYDKLGLVDKGKVIYASGAITDKMMEFLASQKNAGEITLIAKDFTKVFTSRLVLQSFLAKGGSLKVLMKNTLLAVCVNPTSPRGSQLDSALLCEKLREQTDVPVYDIMKLES